jgi:hypothetical protein
MRWLFSLITAITVAARKSGAGSKKIELFENERHKEKDELSQKSC